MNSSLSFERHLRHSPERVWKALTDSKMLSCWYLDNDFSPIVGQKFTFRLSAETGFDGLLCGEIIRADEPHQLIYTLRGGPLKGETVVTWTLVANSTGTLLTLHHTGFNDGSNVPLSIVMNICPSRFLDRLTDVLDAALLVEV